jgi:hypothetical protein
MVRIKLIKKYITRYILLDSLEDVSPLSSYDKAYNNESVISSTFFLANGLYTLLTLEFASQITNCFLNFFAICAKESAIF